MVVDVVEIAKAKNLQLAIYDSNLHIDFLNNQSVFKRNPKIVEIARQKRENVIARLSTDKRCNRVESGFSTPYGIDLTLKSLAEENNDLVVN